MTDSGPRPLEDEVRWARLTDKQRACLDLVLEHQTSKQIARRLDISKQAVDLRLRTARDTLGVANRAETAIVYGRLKQTYDRISCDPIIVAPAPSPMSSPSPDGGRPEKFLLSDRSGITGRSGESIPPFGDLWRHGQGTTQRVTIIMAILVAVIILVLGGLGIAQGLSQLVAD